MLASKQVLPEPTFGPRRRPHPLPATSPDLELDVAPRLRVLIAQLSRRLRPTKAAVEAGLTPTRSVVLQTVSRRGPTRLSELAESEGINPTMLSRVTSDLVEAGLLERSSDEGDRRAIWVRTTTAGKRLADRIRRERTDAVSLALEGLSKDERRLIEHALPALERLADQLKSGRP
jgi:DNA-binding MarR family transcriptional regulator